MPLAKEAWQQVAKRDARGLIVDVTKGAVVYAPAAGTVVIKDHVVHDFRPIDGGPSVPTPQVHKKILLIGEDGISWILGPLFPLAAGVSEGAKVAQGAPLGRTSFNQLVWAAGRRAENGEVVNLNPEDLARSLGAVWPESQDLSPSRQQAQIEKAALVNVGGGWTTALLLAGLVYFLARNK